MKSLKEMLESARLLWALEIWNCPMNLLPNNACNTDFSAELERFSDSHNRSSKLEHDLE